MLKKELCSLNFCVNDYLITINETHIDFNCVFCKGYEASILNLMQEINPDFSSPPVALKCSVCIVDNEMV